MPKRRAGRSDGCGVRLECRRKPCGDRNFCRSARRRGRSRVRLGLHPPGHPVPAGPQLAAARGRLSCWTSLDRAGAGLWGWEGLAGVPVAPTASALWGHLGHTCGLPVPRLHLPLPGRLSGVAPGPRRAVGATPRGLRGCRYGWIKGLPVTTRSRSAGQRRSWSGSRCRSRCRLPLPGEVRAPRDQRRGVRGDCPDAHARQRQLREQDRRGGPAPDLAEAAMVDLLFPPSATVLCSARRG